VSELPAITITRPDDWHLHVRDGAVLQAVIAHSAAQFGRALIMPNLVPPVTDIGMATAYRSRILDALPQDTDFSPLMSLYLTDNTARDTVVAAADSDHVLGFKLYPAGATTNSDAGVTAISRVMHALEAMADLGVVLQVHGEVTDAHVDVFDREAVFIEQVLVPLRRELPELRIVMEHVTTRDGVDFVREAGSNVAATITAHHLLFNRNALFHGGIRPHYYCLPILKRRQHQEALLKAATGGDPSFFLGTDSAPHLRGRKENDCGCAGIYTAHAALELYAEAFEQVDALERLEGFAAHHGADFYRLPRNGGSITLERMPWRVDAGFPVADAATGTPGMNEITPLRAGENIRWRLRNTT
jgi:dihydroorotase